MSEELKDGLLALKIKIGVMEKEIGLPKNNLSGILNGSRPFPQKWVRKIEDYIKLKTEPQVEKFTMDEIEKKLHDLGIFHFWQIAGLGPEAARSIGEEVGLPGRMDGWIAQAKELTAE